MVVIHSNTITIKKIHNRISLLFNVLNALLSQISFFLTDESRDRLSLPQQVWFLFQPRHKNTYGMNHEMFSVNISMLPSFCFIYFFQQNVSITDAINAGYYY